MSELRYNASHVTPADEAVAFFRGEDGSVYPQYVVCAEVLRDGLEQAAIDARLGGPNRFRLIELAIQPFDDMRKLYGDPPDGTKVLMEVAYQLTGAAEMDIVSRDTILHGQYDGEHVYFIEGDRQDAAGKRFKTWSLSAGVPEAYLSSPRMSESERERLFIEVQDELNALPLVDEPPAAD